MATTERRYATGDIPGQDRLITEWAGDSDVPFRNPVDLIADANARGTLLGEYPLVPAPAYADLGFEDAELNSPAVTLLQAHGTITDRKLTRVLLSTLIRDLVLTVTSGAGDSMLTHVQFKGVAAIPPAGTTRKVMFDQINKFVAALGITSVDDWGEIGSSSQPFSLMASYRVVRCSVFEAAKTGGLP